MLAEAQRLVTLATMGIDVYLLRAPGTDAKTAAVQPPVEQRVADAVDIALLVALTHGAAADPNASRLRAILPQALGIAASRIHWIEADAMGKLPPPPAARAYLTLGQELPHALGEHLSTMQQTSAVIAVADTPKACMHDALAKRALWQALKPVARHLHRGAH